MRMAEKDYRLRNFGHRHQVAAGGKTTCYCAPIGQHTIQISFLYRAHTSGKQWSLSRNNQLGIENKLQITVVKIIF